MKTTPFSDLRREIDADPVRRKRVERITTAMLKAAKLVQARNQRGATKDER